MLVLHDVQILVIFGCQYHVPQVNVVKITLNERRKVPVSHLILTTIILYTISKVFLYRSFS
jgi:hypothetical protein